MEATFAEKIRALNHIKSDMVLVQQHELERIREDKSKSDYYRPYIDSLYEHYIINKLQKPFLF